MVFRTGALASDADVAAAAAAACRLRDFLHSVGTAARAAEAEPQAVYAYLVQHMHAAAPPASSASPLRASFAAARMSAAAAEAAPAAWPAADAALGGAARAAALGGAVAELRRVVRVKVQDNNDLALAGRVVADACAFFDALAEHAAETGASPAAALKALRAS
jgi:hypothetical protein